VLPQFSGRTNDSSTLNMEAADLFQTLVPLYQNAGSQYPEDSNLHSHRRENLKPHNAFLLDDLLLIFCRKVTVNGTMVPIPVAAWFEARIIFDPLRGLSFCCSHNITERPR
jgi:hypothetical protein